MFEYIVSATGGHCRPADAGRAVKSASRRDTVQKAAVNRQLKAPRWGNWLSRGLARLFLRMLGFKVQIEIPDLAKLVLVGAPHTSNWDGVVAIPAIMEMGIRINWFAKDSLFKFPFKKILLALGGVPIRRDKARGVVEQTTDIFAAREQMYVVLAPEGTRKATPIWKSGFYQIAAAANVPILLTYVDYKRKVVGSGPLMHPSGDYAADLKIIQDFYRTIPGKVPENFAAEG